MVTKWLHPITLLPTGESLQLFLTTVFQSRTKRSILLLCAFCSIAFITDIGSMIMNIVKGSEYKYKIAFVLGDTMRLLYYLGTYSCRKYSVKIQLWCLAFSSLIYSVMITELHIYSLDKGNVIGKILSIMPLFVLIFNWTTLNFLYFAIPLLLALLYPIFRLFGNFIFYLLDLQYSCLLTLINMVLAPLLCAYFTRKFAVTEIREKHLKKRISEQWKQAINLISNGILILSNDEPYVPHYLNPALKDKLQRLYPDVKEEEDFKNCLYRLEVRIDNNESPIKKSLMELIKGKDYSTSKKYYIANVKDSIEIKIHTVIFDNSEAQMIVFSHSTSDRSVGELSSETKNKTRLIATISHELRSPVTGILNALELISRVIPNEEKNLIERSKECCNTIIAHVNDLTVFRSNKFRIMGNSVIQN